MIMQHPEQKQKFLREEYIPLLQQLDENAERRWGKMNVRQMIEHMADYFRIGSGRDPQELMTPQEHLGRLRDFLMSEKPFRENTPNSLLPDTPPPARHPDIKDAIAELKNEIDHFFESFERNAAHRVINPFFGELDFAQSVQLLHKHAWHHLRQFGLEPQANS